MVPSEAEIEARLAELRRRREAIDREIADHLLYLELGRRLRSGAPAGGTPPGSQALAGSEVLPGSGPPGPSGPAEVRGGEAGPAPSHGTAPPHGPAGYGSARSVAPHEPNGFRPDPWGAAPDAARSRAAAHPLPAAAALERAPAPPGPGPGPSGARHHPAPEGPPPPVPFDEDPAAARRYGRALVEAAVLVLAEAGRPMHAGEILEHLAARGFGVPGQDPVAALNTRLWKRSGPGGPLRRLGDAVYDRAGPA